MARASILVAIAIRKRRLRSEMLSGGTAVLRFLLRCKRLPHHISADDQQQEKTPPNGQNSGCIRATEISSQPITGIRA